MGFLDKLFGGSGSSADSKRVVDGLKTILANEKTLSPSARQLFWQSHRDKSKEWHDRISKILLQSPDQDTPQEAQLRIPPSNHVAYAYPLAVLVNEVQAAYFLSANCSHDIIATHAHCLRLVAFSNVISYVATSGRDVSFDDMSKLYADSLKS